MTQVNQAFEDFYNENKHLYTDTSPYGIMLTTFQAATKASESEINSLKERVKELQSHLSSQVIEITQNDVTLESYAHKVAELQADNERLRDALEIARDYQFDAVNQFHSDFAGYKEDKHKQYDEDLAKTDKALESTPAQSLVEHDNKLIDRCKNIVADDALAITFQSMGAYRSEIIRQLGELKATS